MINLTYTARHGLFTYYHPQTKFAKVMFLHLSFILSTGEGVVSQHAVQQVSGGWYPSMPCRFPGPHPGEVEGLARGGVSPDPHPRGKLRGLAWGRVVSRPTPRGMSAPRGVFSQGSAPRRGLLPGGCLLREGCGDPRDSYCCGRYATASYLNAFLFITGFCG